VSDRRITRRRALFEAVGGLGAGVGVAGLGLAGCGGSRRAPAPSGSTLQSTWVDPVGDARLRVGAGEPLLPRTDLGPRAVRVGVLATLAHLTDAHVLDASSPARVTFLDRLGAPFESTFRPQEALTVQVLAGAAAAIRALGPQLVIQGGDLIDNDQSNELGQALGVLAGGAVQPGSGPGGYHGVQLGSDPDPFYYRPDVDAPRHPGLLAAAARHFAARGLGVPWVPVLGDHDVLVAGELVPTELTRSLALGGRALWDLPSGLTVPPDLRSLPSGPDGPVAPVVVDQLLAEALRGPTVAVPADAERREMGVDEVVSQLRRASSTRVVSAADGRLDYVADVGDRLRLVVLDLARRDGGSGGLVAAGQPEWLAGQLADDGGRWLIVVSHQPLASSEGGSAVLDLLDRSRAVIATLCGHTHRNRIAARHSPAGGYWQIETASLVDYPQQARALRVLATAGGGVAIQTWMLDHVFPGPLGTISRELAYLDAQGGRPQGFAGARLDRNVVLFRAP
jgi:3',5'-cyclic AMP phosphodiesterase CpdA